jgi:hypothetical protein
MSTTTTNFGWTVPSDTDLVKDGAAAIRTALGGVDTSFVDLKGGTTGQVLSKASGTDLDFTWVAQDDSNAIQNAIVDAKGDLIVGASADTPARLAVGTNGYVLTANSSATNGVEWSAPAGGGKVLQVVSTTKSDTFTTNATNTWTDITGMSVSITPSATTSKILVFYDLFFMGDATTNWPLMKLLRGSTDIKIGDASGTKYRATGGIGPWTNNYSPAPNTAGSYLDSPATTSSTTYKIQIIKTGGTSADYAYVNRTQADTDDNRGRYASTITVMEIGA